METSESWPSGLRTDPALAGACRRAGINRVLGVGSATAGGRAAVVLVTAAPPAADTAAAVAAALAAALGVPRIDLLPVHGGTLGALVRDWLYQAAQGSGRGIAVRVHEDGGRLDVLVQSIDSSAREVAMRLASPAEPALAALAAVLPYERVEVREG